ncbi:temperature sensing protein-related [Striga hermonthica]|uniref:Temperature sensing protein-related n=1 Tax=Striga hermonthica TaxID=68872 RepID=A0A9N7NDV6_STRHE|nr:temperature sensing protein-related [Striga hermonthica]
MKVEEVNRCQIQEWYPKFKSSSIKTLIHELPEPFVRYLLDDAGPFLLPLSISNDDALPNRVHKPDEEADFIAPDAGDPDDEAEDPGPPPSFPDLEAAIKSSIETLGGAAFPKLNWSSPKDSAWISPTGDLKCKNFSDIALLLKSSDSVVHDLCHAYDSCSDSDPNSRRPAKIFLALRKWYTSFRPEMEFRCFVRFKVLVGICQREVTNFYPALLEKKGDLGSAILEFFEGNVREGFGSDSYTFDVYVTRDGRVKLVDFNPWGGPTLPLLFDWDELDVLSGDSGLEFRVVENRCGIRPCLKTAVPYDYLDTSSGSGWDQFFRNAHEELRKQMSASEAGA